MANWRPPSALESDSRGLKLKPEIALLKHRRHFLSEAILLIDNRKPCYNSCSLDKRNHQRMGGCCCSTRNSHLNGTPAYYYCPLAMEERESSEIHSGSASMLLNAGHDLNLDLSIPNTYRSPPTPVSYTHLDVYKRQLL
ncbi:uncharacterized protein LOC120070145 [Benincasa hispida]|uniref:uncharacterized protein LOC120070145 n=1 Tax=Benincasa hispida TaxID=102211 RepID=UPI00190237B2|nr:uncharacterized protein LOC120070145 [Benincasa hispida]